MALSLLARPAPSRALLIARLHYASPAAMDAIRFSSRSIESLKFSQSFGFSGRQSASLCKHNWILLSGGSVKHRCFCSSSGSRQEAGNNTSNVAPPYQQQQAAGNFVAHTHQQQQPSGNMPHHNISYAQSRQEPANPSLNGSNAAFKQHQPPHSNYGGAPSPGSQGPQQPIASAASPTSATSPVAGVSSPPRTSAAAEVIDKYLGPSTLKLEKRDEKSPPPPPPPPRRNYGPQGNQEKKSGKDLVAESAACAVIEKYLGPWPGFPPRDPKIDEYLDSLPENAACAAIDKYFGPYKPLFVFKKNEENANNPPPPNRPPRNRMTSRARNRAWNASQQGASVERPWTALSQQGSTADATRGGQYSPSAGVYPSQGATSVSSAQAPSAQNGAGVTTPQPNAMPPPPGTMSSQSEGVPPNQHGYSKGMAPQQGAAASPSPQGTHTQAPHGGASSQ